MKEKSKFRSWGKVLIIAYYFPPLGMGGVQRVTKFVKYLPLFGWKPYVLTVKEVEYWAKDYSLLEDIPPEAETIRTGSFDPLRVWFILKNIFKKRLKIPQNAGNGKDKSEFGSVGPVKSYTIRRSKLLSWLFFPDNKVGWIPFALMKGLKLCRREKIDLIFSSSPPPSLHLTGYLLKLFTGIPWVADFRDPWTGYKLESYPTRVHLYLKKKMERLIMDKADKVITANPAITTDFKRRFPHTKKICLIGQGYDEENFEAGPSVLPEIFTIGYLGTFSPDCDPEPVFVALRNLIDQKLVSEDKIKFIHVGLCMGMELDRLIEKYALKEVFEKKGYLPHRRALNQMQGVSIFLLVTSDDSRIFPAKIFEYLPWGRPILGVVPKESEVGRMISEMGLGMVVSTKDYSAIKEALLFYYKEHLQENLGVKVNTKTVKTFERKFQTEKLASIFEKII